MERGPNDRRNCFEQHRSSRRVLLLSPNGFEEPVLDAVTQPPARRRAYGPCRLQRRSMLCLQVALEPNDDLSAALWKRGTDCRTCHSSQLMRNAVARIGLGWPAAKETSAPCHPNTVNEVRNSDRRRFPVDRRVVPEPTSRSPPISASGAIGQPSGCGGPRGSRRAVSSGLSNPDSFNQPTTLSDNRW